EGHDLLGAAMRDLVEGVDREQLASFLAQAAASASAQHARPTIAGALSQFLSSCAPTPPERRLDPVLPATGVTLGMSLLQGRAEKQRKRPSTTRGGPPVMPRPSWMPNQLSVGTRKLTSAASVPHGSKMRKASVSAVASLL